MEHANSSRKDELFGQDVSLGGRSVDYGEQIAIQRVMRVKAGFAVVNRTGFIPQMRDEDGD